jgi:galactokinase
VNLIGEHTDYNLGFVLPIAIELACYVAVAPNDTGCLCMYSEDLAGGAEWPVDAIPSLSPRRHWTDYIIGVAQQLGALGIPVRASDLLIRSTVPTGAGLSSSASLEVSVALALAGGHALEPLELAKLCHRAENQFVGLPCGIMDQFISVFGKQDAAVRLDCRSLEYAVVDLPPGAAILAVNSMVKHELGASAYRERVAECAAAVDALRVKSPEIASLRDAALSMLDDTIPQPALRRARHIVTENQRVCDFIEAAARRDLPAMGRLLVESHRSLQHDYEVSCDELDFLVDAALSLPGVFGSRMTGGGFGGCTVNLVAVEQAAQFISSIRRLYRDRFRIDPQIYPCRPSAGAGAVFP